MFPSWVFSRLTSWYAHHVDQLPHKKYYRRMNLPYYNIHVGLCFLLLLFHQIQVLHLHLLNSRLVTDMTSSLVHKVELTSDFFLIGRDFKIFKQFFSNSFKFGIGWFEIEIFLELGWRRWFTTSLNFFITYQNKKNVLPYSGCFDLESFFGYFDWCGGCHNFEHCVGYCYVDRAKITYLFI